MNIKDKVALFEKGEAITDIHDRITVSDNDDGLRCVKWSMRFMRVDVVARYTRNGRMVLCANGKLRVTRNRARPILAPYGITIDSKGTFYLNNVPIATERVYYVVGINGTVHKCTYDGICVKLVSRK